VRGERTVHSPRNNRWESSTETQDSRGSCQEKGNRRWYTATPARWPREKRDGPDKKESGKSELLKEKRIMTGHKRKITKIKFSYGIIGGARGGEQNRWGSGNSSSVNAGREGWTANRPIMLETSVGRVNKAETVAPKAKAGRFNSDERQGPCKQSKDWVEGKESSIKS